MATRHTGHFPQKGGKDGTHLLTTAILIIAAIVICTVPCRAQKAWTWIDRDGKRRTNTDLDDILRLHDLWTKSKHLKGEQADLSGAKLVCAELGSSDSEPRTNLREADLSETDFRGSDLSRADFSGADISKAHFEGYVCDTTSNERETELEGTIFRNADLSGANLSGANLSVADFSGYPRSDTVTTRATDMTSAVLAGADLSGADLRDVDLTGAHLESADLSSTELKDADLSLADVRDCKFDPNSLPPNRAIASAKHLEFMTYDTDRAAGLTQLRKQFQDGGFHKQERQITYALNRTEARSEGMIERFFKKVAFDWTCQYGMSSGRLLKIWLWVTVLLSITYAISIHIPGDPGIYIVRKSGSREEDVKEEQIRLDSSRPQRWYKSLVWLVCLESRLLFWGAFFSLMSSFNLSLKDIDFGRWIRLLPGSEFDLKAKGWVRTLAGFQSLISLYLISLWALTYFGRPFE